LYKNESGETSEVYASEIEEGIVALGILKKLAEYWASFP
jgi:hypothetical protein